MIIIGLKIKILTLERVMLFTQKYNNIYWRKDLI